MSLLDRTRPGLAQLADQPAAPLWHAHRLLVAHGLPVARVISVDVDSVLYVARDGVARTAWLTVTHGFVSVRDVAGFPALPPELGSAPSAATGAAAGPPL